MCVSVRGDGSEMFEFAAFTYGVLASFVLASISNNKRAERANPRILTMFGWCLMAFSTTLALLLSGWVAYQTVQGAPLV
jgi:Mn2+/Fe2+ NRAMP family transporter